MGKEILLRALRGEATERPAWVPFVGVHGGALIHQNATEVLRDPAAIAAGLAAAVDRYRPDGLPVVFDLQVEAEILGCELHWAEMGPPSVVTHPLENGGTLADLPAFDTTKGRYPLIREAITRFRADKGEDIGLYGLITGPFTLALHLKGNDIFLDMYDDEDGIHDLLKRCSDIAIQAADFYLDQGVDVIAVVDPMTSQISPEHFQQFVAPYLNPVFDRVRERGALSSLFVCGDATRNLEVMCRTSCDNLSIDENISLPKLRQLASAAGKSFGGNLKLTTVLLLGNEDDARRDALRCLADGGDKGFILAPGCDLPYAVPPANLEAVADMVYDDFKREIASHQSVADHTDSFDDITPPDYQAESDVIIDVVTLDSATCPPCQYMVTAAEKAASKSGGVRVVEHKITNRDGLGYMTKLGVAAIPTICIDGKPTFASIIPTLPELVAAVEKQRAVKGRS